MTGPNMTNPKQENYSCPNSVVTQDGDRIDIKIVPTDENRKAIARCFTPNVWTPALEESMPELSKLGLDQPQETEYDGYGQEDSAKYDPELDPDNF